MSYTRLSITASPGRNYAGFVAKTPAVLVPHAGLFTKLSVTATPGRRYRLGKRGIFTELSVVALPGQRHSFSAKTPADVEPHEGLFTALQVYALPGQRREFLAKTPAPIVITLPSRRGGYSEEDIREILLREDEEILTFIVTVVTSGILDN